MLKSSDTAACALNSAVECHLHTVEVEGSNPSARTNLCRRSLSRLAQPNLGYSHGNQDDEAEEDED